MHPSQPIWTDVPPALAASALSDYRPVAMLLVLVLLMGGGLLGLSALLGPRRRRRAKVSTYECGVPLLAGARQQFSIKFYLVAILFVLFDIESVFLIPWAVVYRDLGFAAVIEMFFFIAVLVVGFVYAWRRGGLDWQ